MLVCILLPLQEKLRTAVKQKDTYIGKLKNAKESQDRELSYLLATNSDLADQNKVSEHRLMLINRENKARFVQRQCNHFWKHQI